MRVHPKFGSLICNGVVEAPLRRKKYKKHKGNHFRTGHTTSSGHSKNEKNEKNENIENLKSETVGISVLAYLGYTVETANV